MYINSMWSGGLEESAGDLIVFARRCAIQALRERTAAPVALGLRAVSALGAEPAELRRALGLLSYAGGADGAALFAAAADDASAALRPVLRFLASAPLDEAGLREFCGEVLFDSTVGRMPVGRGFEPYAPTAPLDLVALELAAVIRDGGYEIERIEVGKALPRGVEADVLGVAAVTAVHGEDDRPMTVHVFETEEPVAEFVQPPGAMQVAAGRLVAILAGEGSLERFRVPALAVLGRVRHGHCHRAAGA